MKQDLLLGLGLLLAGGTLQAQQYLITTLAGGGLPPTGVPAVSASFPSPVAVAVDAHGNVYFPARGWVFKVDAQGVLTRAAGSGSSVGYSGDGGPATSAQLNQPQGVAVDAAGNLYIADTYNCVIRKVAADGTIATVAGSGTCGYAGDGGPATGAQLNLPYGTAVDSAGNLYIADTSNSRIRKVAANGAISTVAGTGSSGYSGDGGPAVSSQLKQPAAVAVDAAGNLYIADSGNNRIREVTGGIITTVAGNGGSGYSGDGGSAIGAQLNSPAGVAVDTAGDLYVADSGNNRIRKVAGGAIATVAGNGGFGYSGDGGSAVNAQLNSPAGVAVDASGTLYISDTGNAVIRRVTAGTIATAAGNGTSGYLGDGGPATSAVLYQPYGMAVDAAGDLLIADLSESRIRKVAPDGTIATAAGSAGSGYSGDGGPATSALFDGCGGVAVDAAGNFFVADTVNSRIRRVEAATGVITTVAGTGVSGYSGDGGPATSAQLNVPHGLALDADGNLYIADTLNRVVRKVAPGGTITTVAGDGISGDSGDGGPATSARLRGPRSLAVDAARNLYIADPVSDRIRKVTAATGIITTVAGNGTYGFSGDGGPATSAQLSGAYGVAVDAAGNIYIADSGRAAIRKVATNGTIATVAGNGSPGYSGDGGPAPSAQFNFPIGVTVDAAGRVYIADYGNNVVRLLVLGGTSPLLSASIAQPAVFVAGQLGATYSVAVSNAAGAAPTSGTVTVAASTGLTLVSVSGTGWNCSGNTCTRSDTLSPGSSYPPITVTVNVAVDAPSQAATRIDLTGGGSPAASASATTNILAPPAAPVLTAPGSGAIGVVTAPALAWNASTGATSYDVYFGASSSPPLLTNTTATSYAPGTLNPGTTYYWQIAGRNAAGTASSGTWAFTTGGPVTGLEFVPLTPCRVVDTRGPGGPFGGPTLAAGSTRSFPIPQGGCGIPGTAQAYSLNVTVVPQGPLYYLTLWPTGQAQANVSTLNSWAGAVAANAAIVPAGTGGAVSVYVPGATDLILDINGYFDTSGGPASYAFYPETPCRVADTRGVTGTFGGPPMTGGQSRDFPIPLSGCGTPPTARAYSLNFTVVPSGYLGYLTAWPTGQAPPVASTLNSWTGKVVANAALVPAGANESISVYVSNPTDVILDIDGYFGLPGGAGALSFYPVTPCRVADTRGAAGPFGGPEMAAGETRSFAIPASGCNIPATAAAYSMNVTVVPDARLSYLSAWPAGSGAPVVSTLNSWDGSVVANAAIVPAGASGAISVYVTDPTHVILDINGYFAP